LSLFVAADAFYCVFPAPPNTPAIIMHFGVVVAGAEIIATQQKLLIFFTQIIKDKLCELLS
jgi:hypothetical protein